jgi:hypothetical protein
MCIPALAVVGTALGASAGTAAAVGTAVTAIGASSALGAYGSYQQGQAAKQVGRNNQIMAEYAAKDAERRGEEDAMKVRQRASQLKGAQRSRLAANGLDLGVGTAADLQDQVDFFAEQDVATARNNARRGAWTARATGNQAAAQGRFDAQQGNLAAFSSLLGGASQIAGKWQSYKGG